MAGLLGPLLGTSGLPLLGPLLGDAPTTSSVLPEPTEAPQPTETAGGAVIVSLSSTSTSAPAPPPATTSVPAPTTQIVPPTPTTSLVIDTSLPTQFVSTTPATTSTLPTTSATGEPSSGGGGIPILIPVLAVSLGVVAIIGIIGVALVTRRRRSKWPFNGRRRSRSFSQLNDMEDEGAHKKAALEARWDPSFR